MITVHSKTTIAAISELRNKSERILSILKENKVVLERRHRPVAVMLGYDQYEALEKILEFAEDYVLGVLAMNRDKKAKKQDFIDIEKW